MKIQGLKRLSSHPVIRDILILILLPILQVIINSNWIFTPRSEFPDSWFYYSYFHYFYDYAPNFPSNIHYFVERLSWNIPGYILYHLFSPLVANYILHLAAYFIAILSLYGILSLLFNRRTALITALLMGSYPWFLRAVGWDYVDGIGIAYFLFTLFLITLGVKQKERWGWSLFGAGIAFALLLISNPFWFGFTAAIGVYFEIIYVKHRRRFIRGLLLFLCGALLTGLIFAVFYKSVTGQFFFLQNSLSFSRRIAKDVQNSQNVISFYGLMPPYWHILPILTALTTIPVLMRTKGFLHYRKAFIACVLLFILSYAWLIFWHLYSTPYLVVFLYSSYIIPGTFLMLGSQIHSVLEDISIYRFRMIIILTIIFSILPLLIFTLFPEIQVIQQNILLTISLSIIFLVFNPALFQNQILLPIIALSIAFIGYIGDTNIIPHVFVADRFSNMNNFLAVEDVISAVNARYSHQIGNYGSFKIWYPGGKYLPTYTSIASVYLYPWGNNIILHPESDRLVWNNFNNLTDKDNLIILTNHSTGLEEANEVLHPLNANVTLDSAVKIDRGDIQFNVLFTTIHTTPRTFDLTYNKKFEFDETINRPNWYKPELAAGGTTFTWSGPAPESKLSLRLPKSESGAQLQICVVGSLAQDVTESLRVDINNTAISLYPTHLSACPIAYEGAIPSALLEGDNEELLLTFQVNRTLSWRDIGANQDPRKFGLAFDWIQFTQSDNPETIF